MKSAESPKSPDSCALEATAYRVVHLLSDNAQRLATAESCTGGWVAQALTAIPGSSSCFDRGFVCYSNDAKREMLGVPSEALDRHGAVSEATAAAMALGALRHSPADWALSITGVAGPDGGTPAKPVGTVCFAWAGRDRCETRTRHFEGSREAVRAQSVFCALEGLVDFVSIMVV
ncbi:MAG: CinA family protein [Candidatus Accumulibacter sp.]|jgi:nicotinamide-nucleotide amidase|nr:CinA family protein [Accumulibacter sp.]